MRTIALKICLYHESQQLAIYLSRRLGSFFFGFCFKLRKKGKNSLKKSHWLIYLQQY